jgi:hypothetical protein
VRLKVSNSINELSTLLQTKSILDRESVIERIKKICKAKTKIIDSLDILQSLFERNASLVTYTSGLILQARFFVEADLALNECLSRKIADADVVCKGVESKGKHLLDHKASTHPCPADHGGFKRRYKEMTANYNLNVPASATASVASVASVAPPHRWGAAPRDME